MGMASETPLSANPASTRWVWGVRAAATTPLVLFVTAVSWLYVPHGQCSEAPAAPAVLAFDSSPVWIPYLYILWRLRRGADKRGLRWAVVWGSLVSILTTIGLFSGEETPHVVLIGLGLFALFHAAMVTGAVKAYRAALVENPNWPTPPRGYVPVIAYVLLLMLVAVAIPSNLRTRREPNPAMAVGSLRAINVAEVTYADTYKTGFSPNLAALQDGGAGASPSATRAGLIDGVLAGGKKTGYTFVYSPGPKNQAGRIVSYTVVARPLDDTCGNRSFFTDESGVIRQTEANRAATVKDPALN